jgi:hypothetical protein
MCTSTDSLRVRWEKAVVETNLSGTWVGDFPQGALNDNFTQIEKAFRKLPATQQEAKALIERLLNLSEDVDAEFYKRESAS